MTPVPDEWFDALGVDPDDVARVGYGLAEYAEDHEAPRLAQEQEDERKGEVIEDLLMLATTTTDAATLLALVDPVVARDLLARAATLFETAQAPEAWVVGMASGGSWRPLVRRGAPILDRPDDGMSSLAALNAHLEVRDETRASTWRLAASFGDNPSQGWNALGVPSNLFAEFAARARQQDLKRSARLLDAIIERSDEVLLMAQEYDRSRWRKFLADVPLVDPELLALGSVASRVDSNLVSQMEAHELSPARVAVLAGSRLREGPPTDQPN